MRNDDPQSDPYRSSATGPEAVRAALERQGLTCGEMGSPFMAELMGGIGDRLAPGDPVSDALLAWPGRPHYDALALRIAGGLHALARTGRRADMAAIWPGARGRENARWSDGPCSGDPAEAARAAFREEPAFLLPWLDGPPQTNEPGRSAVLLGGALIAAARLRMPFELLEVGASAGLNLMFDRWAYDLGNGLRWGAPDAPAVMPSDWRGTCPSLDAPLRIISRAGCDLNPVDPADPAARERMLAYIWPDQHARRMRIEKALDAAAAAGIRAERADVTEWLPARLAEPQAAGTARLVVHTIVRQYLPEPVAAALDAALAAAGARASPDRPLLHLSLEPDGRRPGAAVRLTTWPGGAEELLGRADYHGRWADWAAPGGAGGASGESGLHGTPTGG